MRSTTKEEESNFFRKKDYTYRYLLFHSFIDKEKASTIMLIVLRLFKVKTYVFDILIALSVHYDISFQHNLRAHIKFMH